MSASVKHFHSDMVGAPVLSGSVGAMVGLLDACLVNGWGSGTVDSITIAGGIATVTRGAGHPFEVDAVSEIAGATVSGGSINGHQKVLSVGSSTYTFAAPGIADQVATGTITHKVAPLGFAKPYSGTNLAVYRPADVTGTRFYLRVDDTDAQQARAVGYETMTAISTGTKPFPTEAQAAGGRWWPKSNASSGAARRWVLFGNSKFFLLCVRWNDNTGTAFSAIAAFGDILAAGSADAYACLLNGASSSAVGGTPGGLTIGNELDSTNPTAVGATVARSFTGLGAPAGVRAGYPCPNSASASTRSGDTGQAHVGFPNGADAGLYVSPVNLSEISADCLRGRIPGFYAFPQKIGASVFGLRERVSPVVGLTGRTLMVLNSSNGCFGVDITGPWE